MAVDIIKNNNSNIILNIRDDNIASQKIALKSGFERSNKYINKNYPHVGVVKFREYYYKGNAIKA